jgi:hypothetical protein
MWHDVTRHERPDRLMETLRAVDDGRSGGLGVMPKAMRRELAELGLL